MSARPSPLPLDLSGAGFLFLLAAVIVGADDEVTARVNALLAKHHAQHGHFKDTAALISIAGVLHAWICFMLTFIPAESVLGPPLASHNTGRKPLWMSPGNVQEAAPDTSSEVAGIVQAMPQTANFTIL